MQVWVSGVSRSPYFPFSLLVPGQGDLSCNAVTWLAEIATNLLPQLSRLSVLFLYQIVSETGTKKPALSLSMITMLLIHYTRCTVLFAARRSESSQNGQKKN